MHPTSTVHAAQPAYRPVELPPPPSRTPRTLSSSHQRRTSIIMIGFVPVGCIGVFLLVIVSVFVFVSLVVLVRVKELRFVSIR